MKRWTPKEECAFFFHEPLRDSNPHIGRLIPGDVCPVCGVLDDPYLTGKPVDAKAVETELRERERRRWLAMQGEEAL